MYKNNIYCTVRICGIYSSLGGDRSRVGVVVAIAIEISIHLSSVQNCTVLQATSTTRNFCLQPPILVAPLFQLIPVLLAGLKPLICGLSTHPLQPPLLRARTHTRGYLCVSYSSFLYTPLTDYINAPSCRLKIRECHQYARLREVRDLHNIHWIHHRDQLEREELEAQGYRVGEEIGLV